jgi:DNA topoisomerase-6 subunit B
MDQKVEREPAFGSISVAEFFYRNRQMAGFGNRTQALYSTVRELVENSLDSCEEIGFQPQVRVEIETLDSEVCRVSVSDNGEGIPDEHVPDAFAKVLYGSKYHQRQCRGAFGLGVTMAVLYGQITTDSPVIVHTRNGVSDGKEFTLLIDVKDNTPIVKGVRPLERASRGTSVTLDVKADLKRAQERIMEYLRLTTVSTPYAELSLVIDGSRTSFGPYCNEVPRPPIGTKPHPRSADLEVLRRLISDSEDKRLKAWLIDSFQRVGERSADRFLEFMNLDSRRSVSSLTRQDLVRMSAGLRKYGGFEGPDSRSLSPIGKDAFLLGVRSVFNTSTAYYSSRAPTEWDGNAFAIEGILAAGDDFPRSDIPTIYRFANRVPLLYDASEDVLTRSLRKINWGRYNLSSSPPVALFVNVSSTRIPFKAAGKQSIDSIPEVENEVLFLYKDLGRRLRKVLTRHGKTARESRRMREFGRTFRLLAKYSASLADCEIPPIDKMIRQLFEVESDE